MQAPQGDSAALQLSLQATFRDLLAELVLGVILLVDTIEIAPEGRSRRDAELPRFAAHVY